MEFCWLQKFYKTMSEMKGEVEYVIKTGRQVVERKQVDFPDKLSAQVDAIKQQYNDLGASVRFFSFLGRAEPEAGTAWPYGVMYVALNPYPNPNLTLSRDGMM